jgi:hypothetical protein
MRTLPERLLLISLDHDGKPRDPRSSLTNGLAGAALMELVLAGRLDQDDGRLVTPGPGRPPATSCSTSSWPRSAAGSGPASSSGG